MEIKLYAPLMTLADLQMTIIYSLTVSVYFAFSIFLFFLFLHSFIQNPEFISKASKSHLLLARLHIV